jgi:hypothetical protein
LSYASPNGDLFGVGTSAETRDLYTNCPGEPPVFTVDMRIHEAACFWNHRTLDCTIPRSLAGFGQILPPILLYASLATLIDPYLEQTARYTPVVHLCMEKLALRTGLRDVTLEINTRHDTTRRGQIGEWQTYLRRIGANVITSRPDLRFTYRVNMWQEAQGPTADKMHGRFVLTEVGGVQVEYGIGVDDQASSTTYANLLSYKSHQQIADRYRPGISPFTLHPDSCAFS